MNYPIILFESLPIVQPRQELNYVEQKQFDRLSRSIESFGKSYSHFSPVSSKSYSIRYEILYSSCVIEVRVVIEKNERSGN